MTSVWDDSLPLLDRLGRLLRRRRRQCGLGAGLLCFRIGPRRFGRYARRASTRRHRLGRSRWFGLRTRRRLQRLAWPAPVAAERAARSSASDRPEMTSPVVTKAAANRKSLGSTALAVFGTTYRSPQNCSRYQRPVRRMVPLEPPAKLSVPTAPPIRRHRLRWRRRAAIPWRSRRAPPPRHCPCGAPEFPRRPRAGSSARCRRCSRRP